MCEDRYIEKLPDTDRYSWLKPKCHLIYFAEWLKDQNVFNDDYRDSDSIPWRPLVRDFKLPNKDLEDRDLYTEYYKGAYIGKGPRKKMKEYLSQFKFIRKN